MAFRVTVFSLMSTASILQVRKLMTEIKEWEKSSDALKYNKIAIIKPCQ